MLFCFYWELEEGGNIWTLVQIVGIKVHTWVTYVQSTTGIKYHWHVNRSSFPHPNAQIVRINTIGTQTERVTTVSRLPINYHCHQSVVVDMVLSTSKLRNEAPKDDHQRTSSDIVHPAVGKRATNHRWYGEYQAGLITVCIQWPYCWRYHLD